MTDEIKTCDCKEKAIAKIKEFLFIAGAVFVGGTLSILLSANLLKPKYPMGPMGPRPGIHRQMPPMMHGHFDRGMVRRNRGDCPCRKFKKHHRKGEFKGHKWDNRPVQAEDKAPKKD